MAVNIRNTLNTLDSWETKINQNKVTNFAYTQEAYNNINYVDGVEEYDVSAENNIPVSDIDVIKVNETIVSKGFRSKASSLTRMLMNHMFGRVSYNLNKIHDNFQTLLTVLKQGFHPFYVGECNSISTSNASQAIYYIDCPNFVLEKDAKLIVKFKESYNDTPNKGIAYLNVNSTGNKQVLVSGYHNFGDYLYNGFKLGNDGLFREFYYDGNSWILMKDTFMKLENGVLSVVFVP